MINVRCNDQTIALMLPPCAAVIASAYLHRAPVTTIPLTVTVASDGLTLSNIPANTSKGVYKLLLETDCGCFHSQIYLDLCEAPAFKSIHIPTFGPRTPECCDEEEPPLTLRPNGRVSYVYRRAAQDYEAFRLIRSVGDGTVSYVDNRDPTHGDDTLGISAHGGITGSRMRIITQGPLDIPNGNFIPAKNIYAGHDGLLTQVPPPATEFTQIIGHAETPTSIFVSVKQIVR